MTADVLKILGIGFTGGVSGQLVGGYCMISPKYWGRYSIFREYRDIDAINRTGLSSTHTCHIAGDALSIINMSDCLKILKF